MKPYFTFILLLTLIVTSCNIEKRRYNKGYYVSKKSGLNFTHQEKKEIEKSTNLSPLKKVETTQPNQAEVEIENTFEKKIIDYQFKKKITKRLQPLKRLNTIPHFKVPLVEKIQLNKSVPSPNHEYSNNRRNKTQITILGILAIWGGIVLIVNALFAFFFAFSAITSGNPSYVLLGYALIIIGIILMVLGIALFVYGLSS